MKNNPVMEARRKLEELMDSRRRDQARRSRAQGDLEVLGRMEQELLEEGRKEGLSELERVMLARRVKELRAKKGHLTYLVESIYNKRIKVFDEHIQSLTTVVEGSVEETPSKESIEAIAIKARELLEQLEKTHEVAMGIRDSKEAPTADPEELAILREMQGEQPEPEREVPTMAEAMAETAIEEREEPPVTEKPRKEPVVREEEPPLFEE
jgi:hypothetical protein